ncbi:MAG: hypothetical protein LBS41_02745 [Streptococcaceae bacterium]|nr:hypothetical protein [Streptococcaceae bacterium]
MITIYKHILANHSELAQYVINDPSLGGFNAYNGLNWYYDSGTWSNYDQDTPFKTTLGKPLT